jgi:hypothetical protein
VRAGKALVQGIELRRDRDRELVIIGGRRIGRRGGTGSVFVVDTRRRFFTQYFDGTWKLFTIPFVPIIKLP